MAKLPTIPELSETVQAIYRAYEQRPRRRSRGLGGGRLGKPCARQLWYELRWCVDEYIEGRILRLFERGDVEEPRVVADLRAIGCEVHAVDEDDKQFMVSALGDHVIGFLDGVVLGVPEAPKTWHLLEVKTHSEKSFKRLVKSGVQASKPEHWAQMQIYMGLAQPRLTRALYVAVNKNTDEIYTERIRFDREALDGLLTKAEKILRASGPPLRASDDPDAKPCTWCPAKSLCHEASVTPAPSCRTCVHARAVLDSEQAAWHCALKDELLDKEQQLEGCDEHLYIPELLAHSERVDSGDGWHAYKVRGRDAYYVNAPASSFPAIDITHLSSTDLYNTPLDQLGEPFGEGNPG